MSEQQNTPTPPAAEQPQQLDPLPEGLEVAPELKDEYRRLLNMLRGNEKLERQLRSRRKGLDMSSVLLVRLDTFIDSSMGSATHSPERLAFELKFAEQMRSMLTQAVLMK